MSKERENDQSREKEKENEEEDENTGDDTPCRHRPLPPQKRRELQRLKLQ